MKAMSTMSSRNHSFFLFLIVSILGSALAIHTVPREAYAQSAGSIQATLKNSDGTNAAASATRFVLWGSGQQVNGSNPGTFVGVAPGGYWLEGHQRGAFPPEYEFWGSEYLDVKAGATSSVTINRVNPAAEDFWIEYNGKRLNQNDQFPPGATLIPKVQVRHQDPSVTNWQVYFEIGWRTGGSTAPVDTKISPMTTVSRSSLTTISLPSITLRNAEGDIYLYIKTHGKHDQIDALTDSYFWAKMAVAKIQVTKGDIKVDVRDVNGNRLPGNEINAILLHRQSDGIEVARVQSSISNPVTFSNITFGNYWVDVYCWDMLTGRKEFSHNSSPSNVAFTQETRKKLLKITVYYVGATVPFVGATVCLDSYNGETKVWTERASGVTDNDGTITVDVWPANERIGEKHRIRVLNSDGQQIGLKEGAFTESFVATGIETNQEAPIGSKTYTITSFTDATKNHIQDELEDSSIGGRLVSSLPSEYSPESGNIRHRSLALAFVAGGSTWHVNDGITIPVSVPQSGYYRIRFKGVVNGEILAGLSPTIPIVGEWIKDIPLIGRAFAEVGDIKHLLSIGVRLRGAGIATYDLRNSINDDWPSGLEYISKGAAGAFIDYVKITTGGSLSRVTEIALDIIDKIKAIQDIIKMLNRLRIYNNEPFNSNALVLYAHLEANRKYNIEFWTDSYTQVGVVNGLAASQIDVTARLDEILLEELSPAAIGPIVQVEPDNVLDMGATEVGRVVSKQSAFTIHNAGDQVLNAQVSISSGVFELLGNSSLSISPGEDKTVGVQFLPQAEGLYRSVIRFEGEKSIERYVIGAAYANSITVITPNDDVSWERGTTQTIRWISQGNVGDRVKIDLYRDNGIFDRTIAASTSNSNEYLWTIPADLQLRNDYRIRVSSTSDASVWDQSDADFSVTLPPSDEPWTVTGLERTTYALAIDPSNPQILYAGTNDGVFKSTDKGNSWVEINNGLETKAVRVLVTYPSNPQILYAGTLGGIYKSLNGGISWTGANNGLPEGTWIDRRVFALKIDPSNSDIVYSGVAGAGIFKSTNGGMFWTRVNNGLESNYVEALAIDPTNTSVLYAGTVNGVYKSTNGGSYWTGSIVTDPTVTLMQVQALEIVSSNPNILYAGAIEGVFKSTDGGNSWSRINAHAGLTKFPHALAPDFSNAKVVYAGTDGAGIFRTSDGGNSWANIGLLGSTVYTLVIDPSNPNIGYAGTLEGVFRSAMVTTWVADASAGDFDGDGDVDFNDFFLFADHFGTTAESPNWEPRFSLDFDLDVDFNDFFLFADLFGQAVGKRMAGGDLPEAEGSLTLKARSTEEALELELRSSGLLLRSYGALIEDDPLAFRLLRVEESHSVLQQGNEALLLTLQESGELLLAGSRTGGAPAVEGLLARLYFQPLAAEAGGLFRLREVTVRDARSRLRQVAELEPLEARWLPQAFALQPNFPNPFNPSTAIGYQLPVEVEVKLEIYNLLGQPVRTLVGGLQPAGVYRVVWDSRNQAGQPVAAGLYFYRLQASNFTQVRKLMLLR